MWLKSPVLTPPFPYPICPFPYSVSPWIRCQSSPRTFLYFYDHSASTNNMKCYVPVFKLERNGIILYISFCNIIVFEIHPANICSSCWVVDKLQHAPGSPEGLLNHTLLPSPSQRFCCSEFGLGPGIYIADTFQGPYFENHCSSP